MKVILAAAMTAILAACAMQSRNLTGTVRYEERGYGRFGPLRVADIPEVLRKDSWVSGTIDLATRELKLTVREPHPWGFPKGPVRIRHSSDLWRLRNAGNRIGYLNLFLIRWDKDGGNVRFVRKQLGENGELYPDHPDLLRHAHDGDLILGMRGF